MLHKMLPPFIINSTYTSVQFQIIPPLAHMATSSKFYSRSRSLGASALEEQTCDDWRLNTIESAIHALQQQQSGASAQLSVFSEKVDIMEERIKLSYPCHVLYGCAWIQC